MQTRYSDYVVIGSGVAGLFCALNAAAHGRVSVLTRGEALASNTYLAQGGIAAAVEPDDSPHLHFQDTMRAGAGACDPEAVRVLVEEGPARLQDLAGLGVPFDTRPDGSFFAAREAAHSLARVIPARGDRTGEAVASTLAALVRESKSIDLREGARALELLSLAGRCVGVLAMEAGEPTVHLARAVVLAAGGLGRIFARTTNSRFCTGEGLAMAYRAGARLADLEFIQFHPTALDAGEDPLPLISEAVRGRGALLVDQNGRRFMTGRHPWAELAPRDVAARAIFDEQARGNKVFLDARALNGDFAKRFPHIFQACREHGLDPRREPLPVTPAAHFLMGGVVVDLSGASSLPGLYACGEAARTGAHGANRLASNSLLEALVFGRRTAQALAASPALPVSLARPGGLDAAELEALLPPSRPFSACLPGKAGAEAALTTQLREAMWRSAGLVRRGPDLRETLKLLADLERRAPAGAVELRNMITTARLAASAALARRESRGGHFRSDYPHADASLSHVTFFFSGCETQDEPIAAPRDG